MHKCDLPFHHTDLTFISDDLPSNGDTHASEPIGPRNFMTFTLLNLFQRKGSKVIVITYSPNKSY